VTFFGGVSTLFRRAVERAGGRRSEDPDYSLDDLRGVFAGQKPSGDLLADLEDLGADTSQAYGYSEAAGTPTS